MYIARAAVMKDPQHPSNHECGKHEQGTDQMNYTSINKSLSFIWLLDTVQ
jgi:hypothetical protein